MKSSLKVAGYDVTTALSAAEARVILEKRRPSAFEAVLTDHRMPGETGLELMSRVRSMDETLSTIIITAEGEKELIKQSLAGGAAGFLEKPVTHEQLTEAIARAVRQTERHRRHAENEEDLAAAGRFDEFLNTQIAPEVVPHVRLFYRPLHEIGGDFLKVRRTAPHRFILIVGDISGHSATAGYVSSYFQGLARAGLDAGRPLADSLGLINRILCDEWGPAAERRGEMLTSLALAAIEIDLSAMRISTTIAGFPPPILVDEDGFARACGPSGFPLGWMPGGIEPSRLSLSSGDALLVFSDGLTDWSNELEIDPMALAFSLLTAREASSELIMPSSDDLILARFQIDPEIPMDEQFQPIIHERYAGNEIDAIDELEAVWRRSLVFALELELGERIFDLLICMREAVLNALIHGCDRSAAKACMLQVSYRASDRRVRVRVDDPGKGHQFNFEERLARRPLINGRQLGLGMIQHLSDKFAIDNHGTSVVFDFVAGSPAHEHA